jgi:ribosomal subunit interface protein
MQLSVKGKQVDVGDALRAHVEKHMADMIGKYFNSPIDATVTFSREAHLFRADLSVHASRGILLQSNASSSEPYPAFDEAANHMAARLRRHKNKIRDHHHQRNEDPAMIANAFVLNAPREDAEDSAEDHPVVVAEMTTPIDLLTVSEAVMRLDLGDMTALMFRNRANGKLNMIYRRPDGHIGWVDPSQNIAVNKTDATVAKTATGK